MAGNPALKVWLDWDMNGNFTGTHDDCSDRAVDDPGAVVVSVDRGGNLDGAAATPGTFTVRLQNRDNKFSAGYSGSPIAGKIVPGVPIRVHAIYNGTPYAVAEGRVDRFVPSTPFGSRVCDVICEDDMRKFEKRSVSIALSESRSIWEFREALLTAIGFTAGQMSLSKVGAELSHAPTGADGEDLLSILAELANATRSLDFMRPLAAGGSQYVVKDRATMLGGPTVATYTTAQAGFDQWDVSGKNKVNYQLVQAEPYVSGQEEEMLWRLPRAIDLAAGQTRVKLAKWSDPILIGFGHRRAERTRYEVDLTGTASVTVGVYSMVARLTMSGGASGGSIKALRIFGYPAIQESLGYVESDKSAGDLAGRFDGGDISSRFLASDDEAQGLADYITFVGTQQPTARPTVFFQQDLFPDILQREPGDKIVVSDARLGIVSQPVVLESTQLQMLAGGHWRLAAPARTIPAVNYVQIDGNAGNGIGSAATIGY